MVGYSQSVAEAVTEPGIAPGATGCMSGSVHSQNALDKPLGSVSTLSYAQGYPDLWARPEDKKNGSQERWSEISQPRANVRNNGSRVRSPRIEALY